MMLSTICARCNAILTFPDNAIPRPRRCPQCGGPIKFCPQCGRHLYNALHPEIPTIHVHGDPPEDLRSSETDTPSLEHLQVS